MIIFMHQIIPYFVSGIYFLKLVLQVISTKYLNFKYFNMNDVGPSLIFPRSPHYEIPRSEM